MTTHMPSSGYVGCGHAASQPTIMPSWRHDAYTLAWPYCTAPHVHTKWDACSSMLAPDMQHVMHPACGTAGQWRGSTVACKLLVGDHAVSSKFYLEAALSKQLSHPNVLQTFSFQVSPAPHAGCMCLCWMWALRLQQLRTYCQGLGQLEMCA